ncbi:relaxase/mobilization nuclease domain-containing protein [Desertivirga brevis]|uniref:relaxase/mobilization nuclease domain-containing protein n=1 Tax=Desertivirga brevis TaxID=2810310 RepID=UPI001A95F1CC|nr:relaxase/mobilization nuclease domain-containing protein [Pedobacter sp. SYSU D00873]
MIVKILSKSASFNGVRYNSNKVDKDKGVLMKVANFGALGSLKSPRPTDIINYLRMVSSANKKVRYPQFHAVISCKGREKTAAELTVLAEEWLKEMGYGNNPYLLVFHKDSQNNHIHMVSTRVGRDGKKIDDSFEKIRSYKALHKIMGEDESLKAKENLSRILKYNFSTHAQFRLLAELLGYQVKQGEKDYSLCKFGRQLASVPLDTINGAIASASFNVVRQRQLKAIVVKYKAQLDSTLHSSGKGNYTSELTDYLGKSFGLEFVFHASKGMPPYGYTIIDHSSLSVFKGGEILPLRQLLPESLDTLAAGFNNPVESSGRSFVPDLILSQDVDDESVHQKHRKKKRKQSR